MHESSFNGDDIYTIHFIYPLELCGVPEFIKTWTNIKFLNTYA